MVERIQVDLLLDGQNKKQQVVNVYDACSGVKLGTVEKFKQIHTEIVQKGKWIPEEKIAQWSAIDVKSAKHVQSEKVFKQMATDTLHLVAYSHQGSIILTSRFAANVQKKNDQVQKQGSVVQLPDSEYQQKKQVQLSSIQELRQSIHSSNLSDSLRFSQEYSQTFDVQNLKSTINNKLQLYKQMQVDTQENQTRIRLKLEQLEQMHNAVTQQDSFIKLFTENLVAEHFQSLRSEAQEQATLQLNSQETARVLFKQLQGTKIKDSSSGEELPMLSAQQAAQIAHKLQVREKGSQQRMKSSQQQISSQQIKITNYVQETMTQQNTQLKTGLYALDQIQRVIKQVYEPKVVLQVQRISQMVSLLTGEISTPVIQELQRFQDQYNQEVDACQQFERQSGGPVNIFLCGQGLNEKSLSTHIKRLLKVQKVILRKLLEHKSACICELFRKLSLARATIKLELQKQQEISSEFLIESLDKRTYFVTAQKVTEEVARRKEVNANLGKLWLALKTLAAEEDSKRNEFNASKYFKNVLFDQQQKELRTSVQIADDSCLKSSCLLLETKVAPSIISSMRSFVNEGTLFRSINYERKKVQQVFQDVQSQMQSCRRQMLDLIIRTSKGDLPSQSVNKELKSLSMIKNLEQFCQEAIKKVKQNFHQVLQKGVQLEKQMSSIEEKSSKERSSGSDSWVSQHRSFQLNLNQMGSQRAPGAGDMLLFLAQQQKPEGSSKSEAPRVYVAQGFPGFYLDKRAVVDLQASQSDHHQPHPVCVIGAASRITQQTNLDGSLQGQVYVNIKCTLD